MRLSDRCKNECLIFREWAWIMAERKKAGVRKARHSKKKDSSEVLFERILAGAGCACDSPALSMSTQECLDFFTKHRHDRLNIGKEPEHLGAVRDRLKRDSLIRQNQKTKLWEVKGVDYE